MKRVFLLVVLCLLTVFQAKAVLKEKDLAQTLGVLRAELEQTYNQQKSSMMRFEKRNMEQHANLIKMMQKNNQIALMLYSQGSDFTFDMAYACQAATEQYRTLKTQHMPYDKIIRRINGEIERYNGLIKVLQELPPRVKPNGELSHMPDSIRMMLPKIVLDTAKVTPYMLDKQGLTDREACLDYATAIRGNYVKMLENVTRDQEHYERVIRRVGELNTYALSRYEKIQKNIFVNRGNNYFNTLKRLKMNIYQAKRDADGKYKPLKPRSQWRGPVIFGVCIFMFFYIAVASFLSYIVMRFLLPKRVREKLVSPKKRPYMTIAVGVALFAIFIMVARIFTYQNFICMAIDLTIVFAWLMEVILVSLLIRLSDKQIKAGVRAYMPFLLMAFLVIVFRIILIPNNLVNLIYPPILLLFTIWQIVVLKHRLERLPDSDMVYSVISLIAMLVACVASWLGYVLMAVQVMIWWTIQLAAIQTITCLYDIAKWYEHKYLLRKIAKDRNLEVKKNEDQSKLFKKMQPKMAKGEYISNTWFYDFLCKAMLPVNGVLSVMGSLYWASSIFEMTSVCKTIFMYTFIDKPGIIQLSIFKICLVLAFFFVFKYFNYALHAFFQMIRKRRLNDVQGPINISLVNNAISIVVWGIYIILAFVMLQVPSKGISIVMAGLATGLGFAMKDLLENFVYGLSLMTGRLRMGDYIECDGIQGKVDSIGYQSTEIVTLDGCVISFQNAALFAKNFKNLTRNHGYVRMTIPVGVAYGVNVGRVREMLVNALQKLMVKNAAGKNIVDIKHGIKVSISDFGDSSVNLFIVCWVLVEEKAAFVSQVNEVIYNTLNKNKVEIPFPQQDIYVRHIEMPASQPVAADQPDVDEDTPKKSQKKRRLFREKSESEGEDERQ